MKSFILGLLVIITQNISGQSITPSVIANAGAVMKASNVSLEWTLGEVVTETKTTANLIVTQGFHQTKLGTVLTKNYSIEGLEVYPNPVYTVLSIHNKNESDLNLILYTIDGKEIRQNKLFIGKTELNMESYPAGTYLLVIKNKDLQQEFTINKIN